MADYTKPDFWARKARQEGYPARSVYKLQEMDGKFGLFKQGGPVLDLGAAPGSWSLYALRKLAGRGLLVSCDLAPLSPRLGGALSGGGFVFVQGDFTAPGVRDALLARGPYRLILSDAAPATTGSASVDAQRSLDLAAAALDCALAALAPGGSLAVKVFQGGGDAPLHRALKAAFTQTRSFKPRASRPSSVETYLLGLGKR
jgi:23S rRNA (uridine2552-2'-O)-methyltransferase